MKDNEFNLTAKVSNQKQVKVSIICMTYNHEDYIQATLDGFLMQKTDFDFEVIVIDDHSQDNTAKIVKEYAVNHPGLIIPVLRNKNFGIKNLPTDFLKYIRGEYVALCEGDDYWTDPEKIQMQADFLDQNPEYSICFHQVKVIFEEFPERERFFPEECEETTTLDDLMLTNYIQTNSVMYRWRFRNESPEILNSRAMPGDWHCHILHAEVGKIKYIDKVMGVYRIHKGSMFGSFLNHLDRFKKYGNNEIELYRTLDYYFGGRYHDLLFERQIGIFTLLSEHYIQNNMIEDLFWLIKKNRDIFELALKRLGFIITHEDLSSINVLEEKLKRQAKVSVVVVTYNQAQYISRCLDSILMQEGCLDLEVIIGDDGSKDDTLQILLEYAKEYPETIKLVGSETNVGLVKNLKRCFETSTGEYIAVCEGDDYWLSKKKLIKQLLFMKKNTDCAMCFNWVLINIEDSDFYLPHKEQGEINSKLLGFEDIFKEPITANFSCCFYKAEAVQKVPKKFFMNKHAGDWLFNLCIAKEGYIGFIPEILSIYTNTGKGLWTRLTEIEQKSMIENAKNDIIDFFRSEEFKE